MAGKRASGEGALFQRKTGQHKGKWVARVQVGRDDEGRMKRVDYLFPSQAEAKAKLREVINDLAKGRQPIVRGDKLSDYLDHWLETQAKPYISVNTYARYKGAIAKHIKPDPISQLKLTAVTARSVRELLDRRAASGAKEPTLISIRSTVSSAMERALHDELIHENVARRVRVASRSHRSLRFFSPAEAKKLLAQAAGSELDALLVGAVYTGMRLSELLGLTWDDIDFKRNTISINQQLQRHEKRFLLAPLKSRSGRRSIPLPATLAEKLKALKGGAMLAAQTKPEIPGLVFVRPNGEPLHRKSVLEATKRLMTQAGVPQHGFHALRHTCASILINAGADALRVQRQLGHSTVRLTLDTYAHLFEERLHEHSDIIDRALS